MYKYKKNINLFITLLVFYIYIYNKILRKISLRNNNQKTIMN